MCTKTLTTVRVNCCRSIRSTGIDSYLHIHMAYGCRLKLPITGHTAAQRGCSILFLFLHPHKAGEVSCWPLTPRAPTAHPDKRQHDAVLYYHTHLLLPSPPLPAACVCRKKLIILSFCRQYFYFSNRHIFIILTKRVPPNCRRQKKTFPSEDNTKHTQKKYHSTPLPALMYGRLCPCLLSSWARLIPVSIPRLLRLPCLLIRLGIPPLLRRFAPPP